MMNMACGGDVNLLCWITAPSLQTLTLQWSPAGGRVPPSPLPQFLSRSSCPLRKLTLWEPPYPDCAGLASVTFPHLTELYLTTYLPLTREDLACLADCERLPRLEMLELEGRIEASYTAFVELAEARKGGGSPLQMLVLDISDTTWNMSCSVSDMKDFGSRMRALLPTFRLTRGWVILPY